MYIDVDLCLSPILVTSSSELTVAMESLHVVFFSMLARMLPASSLNSNMALRKLPGTMKLGSKINFGNIVEIRRLCSKIPLHNNVVSVSCPNQI